MKKVYITPEIELDDFQLSEALCANLYGRGRNAEFYAIGSGDGSGYGSGASGMEGNVPDIGGEDADDLF